jgi:hypothetical protein
MVTGLLGGEEGGAGGDGNGRRTPASAVKAYELSWRKSGSYAPALQS